MSEWTSHSGKNSGEMIISPPANHININQIGWLTDDQLWGQSHNPARRFSHATSPASEQLSSFARQLFTDAKSRCSLWECRPNGRDEAFTLLVIRERPKTRRPQWVATTTSAAVLMPADDRKVNSVAPPRGYRWQVFLPGEYILACKLHSLFYGILVSYFALLECLFFWWLFAFTP